MNIQNTIEELLQNELNERNLFLTNRKISDNQHHFRYFIDGVDMVTIGDCAKIARKMSKKLDDILTEDHPFRFEISSPGADEPLVDRRQYFKHIGRNLLVETDEEKIEGKLLNVDDKIITLKVNLDKKKKTTKEEVIPFDKINQTTVKISFK
jgi:ribosome maturation factor RimP